MEKDFHQDRHQPARKDRLENHLPLLTDMDYLGNKELPNVPKTEFLATQNIISTWRQSKGRVRHQR